MMYQASKQLEPMIGAEEGDRLVAYKDEVGVWTIGRGHTGKVNGVPIHAGMVITHQEDDELYQEDLKPRLEALDQHVHVPLNQNQVDALLSLMWNIGIGAFESSTLLKLLNQRNYNGAAEQFLVWDKVNIDGKFETSEGLLKRRQREMALFLKPVNANTGETEIC